MISGTDGNRITKSLQFRSDQCGAADTCIAENHLIDQLLAVTGNLLLQRLDLAIDGAVLGLLWRRDTA